jgi:hypothetical protein
MKQPDPTVDKMKAEFIGDVCFGIVVVIAFGGFLAWLIS